MNKNTTFGIAILIQILTVNEVNSASPREWFATAELGNSKNNCQDWAARVRQNYNKLTNNPIIKKGYGL